MEILWSSGIQTPPFPHLRLTKWNLLKPRSVFCSGKNGESSGFSTGPFQIKLQADDNMEMEDRLQSMNSQPHKTQNDIWQLFKEAQRNILHLNKQRVMAIEELEAMKREKKSYLEKIEQLEVEKQAYSKKDKLSIGSELLLRIDSMVLTGIISAGEASDLRRLVIDSKVSVADDFSDILHKRDVELLAELRLFSDKRKTKGFHIMHICTEMAPVVSVGSLASYVTGLSRALQRKGNFVEVILPKYASLNVDEIQGLQRIEAEFYSYFNGNLHKNRIWTGVVYGIGITFIEPVNYSSFFSRERIYGYSDDFERFTYFSRASLDYLVKSGKQPDVLHIHNWETSIVGPLFWDVFVNQGLGGTRILLTCQGFDSQCLEQPGKLALCGLDPSGLHRPDRMQDNNKSHLVNILKGGVVYSNKVIVLSSLQSKSQTVHSLSYGLEATLATHKDKLSISPCGIDSSTWDPLKDKLLPQSYRADDMSGKAVCKAALQQRLGLPEHASTILVGCIVSEVSDIDMENLATLLRISSRKAVQFVFMGADKISGNESMESLQEEVKNENVIFLDKYDEPLSHLIFAGSDIIWCQSFDDSLLQVPLKAIKYGAAPVALDFADKRFRHNVDHHNFESTKLSQFISNTFANVSLSQAIDEIKNNPSRWNRKIMDAMRKDLSWGAECCDVHVGAYKSLRTL
ncbi:hypothetical protein LguiA_005970 [Lonicera macranthoides]